MPKTTVDPRRLAYEAGLPVIAVADGNGGFVRSLATWEDDWNTSAYGVRQIHVVDDWLEPGAKVACVFTAEDEHRTSHIPAGLWYVAAAAKTVSIRTIGSGEGAQECLVFEGVGDAWDRYEAERAARRELPAA